MLGHVAVVLHAHLPFVRHPEHARSLEERWLYEAIWESYLPLLAMLDGLDRDGVPGAITLSISPPLAAMLACPLLRGRFDDHLARLEQLARREDARLAADHVFGPIVRHYRARLREARAGWEQAGGDLLAAFARHAATGRLELWTTTASHAYLPALVASPPSVRAQLRLGLRAFEALAGRPASGLWLPECAYDPRFGDDLARAGVAITILDAHGVELARPRPPLGVRAPIVARSGTAFFGRDPEASHEVWSREAGYPGDPDYRDFYRDIGFDLPIESLGGEVGPFGARVMTGLKYHRITGPGDHKEPWAPLASSARAREHARDFCARREQALAAAPRADRLVPISVAPYDAELFGHWWFEGPEFLDAVLRELAASAARGGLEATTPGRHLAAYPDAVVAEPAPSSWGQGGFGEVWTSARTAPLWRHIHHAGRRVQDAVAAARGATGVAGRALDQAIRELLLLEASDWAFMIQGGDTATYAEERVRTHVGRIARLASIAVGGETEGAIRDADARWVDAARDASAFLLQLEGERIRDAFDDWG